VILEVAPLQVRPGQSAAFEAAFRVAQRIIATMRERRALPIRRRALYSGKAHVMPRLPS
jgi:hypothetical protein